MVVALMQSIDGLHIGVQTWADRSGDTGGDAALRAHVCVSSGNIEATHSVVRRASQSKELAYLWNRLWDVHYGHASAFGCSSAAGVVLCTTVDDGFHSFPDAPLGPDPSLKPLHTAMVTKLFIMYLLHTIFSLMDWTSMTCPAWPSLSYSLST